MKEHRKIKSQSGVTFIELMIAVVIIGIVAAMAGPHFTREMDRIKFRGAARDAVSSLRLARSLTISQKTPYGVHFDNSKGTITVFKEVVTSNPATFNSGDTAVQVDTIPGQYKGISSAFTGALMFEPNGSANQSGTVLLLSYSTGGDASTSYAILDVLASTGRIKISDLQTY